MNTQEIIERDVRLLIGDLHLQLVMARAQIATLEQQLAAKEPEQPPMSERTMPNGKHPPGEEANAP